MATLNPYGFVTSVPEAMQPKPTILDFLLQAYMAQQQMRDSREDRALKQMEMQLRQKQIDAQTKNLERQAQEQEREAKEKEEERVGLERMAQQMRAVPEAPIREATAQAGPIMGETVNRLLGMNIPVSPKALEGIGGRMSQQMQEAGGLPGVSDPMQLGQLAMQNLPPSAWPQAAKLLQLFQPPAPKGLQFYGQSAGGVQMAYDPNTQQIVPMPAPIRPYIVTQYGLIPNPEYVGSGGMMPPQGIAPSTVAAPGSASMYEPRPTGPADMEGMPPVGMTPPPPLEPMDIPMGGGISVTPPPVNLGSQTAPLPSQLATPPVLQQFYGDTVTPPEPSAPKVFSPADISDGEARGYLNLPTGTIASPKIVMDAKKDLAAIKTKQAEAAFNAQVRAGEKAEEGVEKGEKKTEKQIELTENLWKSFQGTGAYKDYSEATPFMARAKVGNEALKRLAAKSNLTPEELKLIGPIQVDIGNAISRLRDTRTGVRQPELVMALNNVEGMWSQLQTAIDNWQNDTNQFSMLKNTIAATEASLANFDKAIKGELKRERDGILPVAEQYGVEKFFKTRMKGIDDYISEGGFTAPKPAASGTPKLRLIKKGTVK